VTIHFTWKQDWPAVSKLLPVIEKELAPFHARPHWGKLFTLSPQAVQSFYEKLPEFVALSLKHDPQGKFRNEFLNTNVFPRGFVICPNAPVNATRKSFQRRLQRYAVQNGFRRGPFLFRVVVQVQPGPPPNPVNTRPDSIHRPVTTQGMELCILVLEKSGEKLVTHLIVSHVNAKISGPESLPSTP
jgi:hypothetical protein